MHMERKSYKTSSKQATWVIFILLWYVFSYGLIYVFHMSRMLLYVGDVLNIIIFMLAFCQNILAKTKVNTWGTLIWMLLFSFIGIASALINRESFSLLLWGVRNNLRFFLYFYSCAVFLKMQDIDHVLHLVKIAFWISLPLCVLEQRLPYPSGTIIGDMVGGVFWNFHGCNTPLNVIVLTTVLQVTLHYFRKQCSSMEFFATCTAAIVMAALAELKAFFIEFIIIVTIAAIESRFSGRTVLAVILGAIVISFAVSLFITYNGQGKSNYASVFTLQGFLEIVTRNSGYNGNGTDLNRLTGIATVSKIVFGHDLVRKLIGVGIGNAEYTEYFVSPFYQHYSGLEYQWFQDTWIFVETGYMGLVCFALMLISVLKKAIKFMKTTYYGNFVTIIVLLSFLLCVYNITLRSETSGYFLYMILATPYIYKKEKQLDSVKSQLLQN